MNELTREAAAVLDAALALNGVLYFEENRPVVSQELTMLWQAVQVYRKSIKPTVRYALRNPAAGPFLDECGEQMSYIEALRIMNRADRYEVALREIIGVRAENAHRIAKRALEEK